MNKEFKITNQFLDLKLMFKDGVKNIEAFENLSSKLLVNLAEFTNRGRGGEFDIEGIQLDLWKDRVWHLIERSGLLPEYKDEIEEDILTDLENDGWYEDNDEFEVVEKEPKNYNDNFFDPTYGF